MTEKKNRPAAEIDPSGKDALIADLQKQLEESQLKKEMYEKILNSIDEGIHCVDGAGNLIIYNEAQEKLEGNRAADVLGKHLTEVYNLDSKSSLLLQVLQDGQAIYDYHQEYVTRKGKYIDVICSTVPLYSGETIVGSAAILRDFSKFRQMAEKILDLQEKLTVKWSKTTSIRQPDKKVDFTCLLGGNFNFNESIRWAKAAALSQSPVLIVGETGTGKELFAQSIHGQSRRAKGPFLAINCAAIPESLLEGILFGTVKGAFTGAVNRAGLLEQASGGSVFLDEVNSMPLSLQSKLLRVLEDKMVRRLGGNDEIAIDTRIISSCNVQPEEAVRQGQLRSDLFYRLAVIYIDIPPLRRRMDDLDLLCGHFITFFGEQMGKKAVTLDRAAENAFRAYHWPGNVRQLKHVIECAVNVMPADEKMITAEYIPKYMGIFMGGEIRSPMPLGSDREAEVSAHRETPVPAGEAPGWPDREASDSRTVLRQIKDQEREAIILQLKKAKGNMAKAAAELGMSRQLLRYHLKKMGLL